jgi:hypothetical protein
LLQSEVVVWLLLRPSLILNTLIKQNYSCCEIKRFVKTQTVRYYHPSIKYNTTHIQNQLLFGAKPPFLFSLHWKSRLFSLEEREKREEKSEEYKKSRYATFSL